MWTQRPGTPDRRYLLVTNAGSNSVSVFAVRPDGLRLTDVAPTGDGSAGHPVARRGLHFDQARQSGIVFHMISCLTEHGRVGLTAVGDSPTQAEAIYHRAERTLLEEASTAPKDIVVP